MYEVMRIDYNLIEDVQVEGIDYADYPDFCDAFIASAIYDGKPMSDEMLDELNEDYDFVYESITNYIF
jgi:hypothetical protein